MNDVVSIDVALATYNGARFLPEFLCSIATQDWRDLAVIVSDDGSTDRTLDIVTAFDRTNSVHSNEGSGIVSNFNNALIRTSAPYVALADQDDVWRNDKLTRMMSAMQEAERDGDGPVLVFSDLELVNERLETLHRSFYDATDKDSRAKTLKDFLLGNHIPGCAMLMNRALVDLALPIPTSVRMHDWWIALVAAGLGRIVYVDEPLIQYRQHGSNTMGAPVRRSGVASKFSGLERRFVGYLNAARDARNLITLYHDRYAERLPAADQHTLASVVNGGMISRFRALRGARTGSGRIARAALQLLYRA